MGDYVNPGSDRFELSKNSMIYVDKSSLISFTNQMINTDYRFICVSRPRRFGKSMAANMLVAYYSQGENTQELFNDLKIHEDKTYRKHLNQYHVIRIDMQYFMNIQSSVKSMLENLTTEVCSDLLEEFPDIDYRNKTRLDQVLSRIYKVTKRRFVILIDEWDCVMRRKYNQEDQKMYLDYLRDFMKDQPYIALAYMTGILPIKKYGEHSTLNMFKEYSMIDSAQISDCFGFTDEEVVHLCEQFDMDVEQARQWYNGYHLISDASGKREEYFIYSPNSVVDAMLRHRYDVYWNQTETYEALKSYIQLNFDGLKDAIIQMLAGEFIEINPRYFQNDMTTFHSKDDVLTLLVHLGYLSYEQNSKRVSIPNKEVAREFVETIQTIDSYKEVSNAILESKDLLQSLWSEDEECVALGIEKAHQHFSAIQYNNENALSCIIELAFYYAQEYYTIIRELPTGKGFADICFIPRPNHIDKPAVIIELKWNKDVNTAIEQIKNRDYPDALKAYHGNLLLCGINYSKDNLKENKKHMCKIERIRK
ncbi:N-acetylhexosamine 1-kinase [Lachnospiraceae bacterium TWA4]|nr:N-acetylhexosamine 1-kinase [Lachnospiraceae bacterium TWA4]